MKFPRFFAVTVIIVFLVIVLAPIFYMFTTPFLGKNTKQPQDNIPIFDKNQLLLARNSLGIAAGTSICCLAFGITLAFLLHRTDAWGRRLFRTLYIIPLLVPPYMHAIVWSRLYQSIKSWFAVDIHSIWGVVWVLTLSYFPFVTLVVSSGLRAIDRQQEEASLLCHGKWQTLKGVTRPLLTPYIFAATIIVFVFSAVDFGVPDILRVKVYALEVFIQFSAFYNDKAAAILSLPLICVTIILIIWMKHYMQDRAYIQVYPGKGDSIRYPLGRLKIPALIFCLIILGFSTGLPVMTLFEAAGKLSNYINALKNSWQQISYSLIMALSGAFFSLGVGFFLSYLIERDKIKFGRLLELCTLIPLAVPAITIGVGLIRVWNRPGIDLVYASSFIILFGYMVRFTPFTVLIMTSALKQLNPNMEEAASLATDRWLKTVGRIVLPQMGPGLITAFFIVFVLAFRELGTTLLVIPPGQETLPIKIYNLMHYGAEQMVAALCLIMLLIIFVFSGIFLSIQNQFKKKRYT